MNEPRFMSQISIADVIKLSTHTSSDYLIIIVRLKWLITFGSFESRFIRFLRCFEQLISTLFISSRRLLVLVKVSMFGAGSLDKLNYGHRQLPLAVEHSSEQPRIQRNCSSTTSSSTMRACTDVAWTSATRRREI